MYVSPKFKLDSALEVLNVGLEGVLDNKVLGVECCDPWDPGAAALQVDNVGHRLLAGRDGGSHEARHPLQPVRPQACAGGLDPLYAGGGDGDLHDLPGEEAGPVGDIQAADPLAAVRAHRQRFWVI